MTLNESEARSLLRLPSAGLDPVNAATRLRALGARKVIIKLGARGSLLLADGADPAFVVAHRVAAVDTTAAGDCFNGAFAAALSGGATPLDAARFASAASALEVIRTGASDAMPYRAEIEHFASLAAPSAAAIP
ncbi:PfkB family carbohydrate kinase [Sphingomonas bacterium]|uniref:PfkB family carbohydrate kinase n=1 Tax=Sphingomonas bacterium TaxID=1895847 RepID=UPI0020C6A4D3|nr:PfkB family carbohydrate kinase [Sphingomonas bacterium]